jgi:hypothetical protein
MRAVADKRRAYTRHKITPVVERPGFQDEMAVTVVGPSKTAGRLLCVDPFGNEVEVLSGIGRKAGGIPEPGERWICLRVDNSWVPTYHLSERYEFPVIRGSRDGMDPVMVQVLEALARMGLVRDETVTLMEP